MSWFKKSGEQVYFTLHIGQHKPDVHESVHRDTTMKITNKMHYMINLLFQVGSTCFGLCFRPSPEALDCIYSIWKCSAKLLPAGVPIRDCKYSQVLLVMGENIARNM